MIIEEIDKRPVKLQERVPKIEKELVEWLREEKTKSLEYKFEQLIDKMKYCANCINQFDEYECAICQNKSGWGLAE